jgi:hypothetical protein
MENLKEQNIKKNQDLTSNVVLFFLFVLFFFSSSCTKKEKTVNKTYIDSIQNINQLQNAFKKVTIKNKFNIYSESFLIKWDNIKRIDRVLRNLQDLLYEKNTYFLKDDFDNNGYTDLIIYNKDRYYTVIIFDNEKYLSDIYLIQIPSFFLDLKYSISKKDNQKMLIRKVITYDGKKCIDTLVFKNKSFVKYNSNFKDKKDEKISKIIFQGNGLSDLKLILDMDHKSIEYEINRKKQDISLSNQDKEALFNLCYYIYFDIFDKKTTNCYENINHERSLVCIVQGVDNKTINKKFIPDSNIGFYILFGIFGTLDTR